MRLPASLVQAILTVYLLPFYPADSFFCHDFTSGAFLPCSQRSHLLVSPSQSVLAGRSVVFLYSPVF